MQKESLKQIENKWGQISFEQWLHARGGKDFDVQLYEMDSELIACANIIDRTQKQFFAMIESQNELNKQQSEISVQVSTRLIEVEKFCLHSKNFDGLRAADALHNRIDKLETRETFTVVVLVFLAFALMLTVLK